MKSKFLSLLKDFCLLSLLLLLGCSKDSATESPQLPERPNDVEPLPETVELAEGVVQLNNAQLAFVTDIDEGNTQLSFHNSLPEEYLPKVGELLLQTTPTEELPYGFVGRVTRITQQNGNYVVETEAPTLTEVFDKLYTEGEMQSMAETRAKDSEGYYTVSGNMSKAFDKQGITLSGSYNAGIRINSNPRVAIDKEKQQNKILFGYDTKLEGNITLTIAQKLDFEGVKELGSGVPVSKSMGWLPIATYLQPYIVLTASADYGLNLGVTFEGQNSYSVEQNNGLLPTVKRTKENNSIEPSYDVSSKISGECYAGVGLRVEFRLFGRRDMAIGAGADVGAKASGEVGLHIFEDKELSDSLYDLLKENSATITGAARLIAHASLDSSKDDWYQPFAEIEFFKKTYYLLPSFENVSLSEKDGMVSAEATVGRDLLLKADVGIAAWNGDKPSYGKAYPYQFEQEFSHNPITDQFSADDESEYWTYAKIGNFYVKGVKIGEKDKLREMLIKFYHDTGGDNWTSKGNWCSDKPIDEWYGVDYNDKNEDGTKELKIYLSDNNLTGAGDLSGCTLLYSLSCDNNQLTSLDISGCTALKWLDCTNNPITQMITEEFTNISNFLYDKRYSYNDYGWSFTYPDEHGWYYSDEPYEVENDTLCEMLIKFYHDTGGDNWKNNENWCSDKPIDEWYGVDYNDKDGDGIKELEIKLYGNYLTGAGDLSGCTALTTLYCNSNNQLTSLNVSGCTALKYLGCQNTQLTSLNVSSCTALENLNCRNTQLTSLDVSSCTALEVLNCYDNQLTSLNVSGCTALENLKCQNNQLTSLDVSGCTALEYLDCDDNQLTSLDISDCTALTTLYCNSNNQLTSLNVSGCTALSTLSCHDNQLTSLNISGCTALSTLYCHDNQLTSLNVSGCTALTTLYCPKNQLTSLNVSGCMALVELNCYDNQLSSLNVSGCTRLENLRCDSNQLTSLNVSDCTALERVNCEYNQLTSLNVSGCTALKSLHCRYNPITQQISAEFQSLSTFSYDERYNYSYSKWDGEKYVDAWYYNYSDHHGWYYPNEPKSGYTYGGN